MQNYIRAKDIMAIFKIARSTVDTWAKKGYIKRHKIGKIVFYDRKQVEMLKWQV